jgi:hypothetical protein
MRERMRLPFLILDGLKMLLVMVISARGRLAILPEEISRPQISTSVSSAIRV